jgi:hypothetical protein
MNFSRKEKVDGMARDSDSRLFCVRNEYSPTENMDRPTSTQKAGWKLTACPGSRVGLPLTLQHAQLRLSIGPARVLPQQPVLVVPLLGHLRVDLAVAERRELVPGTTKDGFRYVHQNKGAA